MRLSIVIPAFNEAGFIGQTLRRIKDALRESADGDCTWEIVVCDNHSTDDTAAIAAGLGARVVTEPVNQISRARNTGAAAARGEWLLFIDADTYPSTELMAEVFALIERDENIGCGSTVTVEDGTLLNRLRMERLNPLFRLLNWTGGAFVLCRAAAFHAIGGFSMALYAYEEIDFVFRLKRYGRSRGRRFVTLHRHPVVTSGRKGEYGLLPMARLFVSNFAAVVLFALHYALPTSVSAWLGSRVLGYWYRSREE